MKGFTERPSFLIEFNTGDSIKRFKEFAISHSIVYTAFENDRSFRAVVDRKWEEAVFKFVNNYRQ